MKKSNSDKVEKIEDETLLDELAIPRDFGSINYFPNLKLMACIYDPTTDVKDPSSIWEGIIKMLINNFDEFRHQGPIKVAKIITLYSLEEPH